MNFTLYIDESGDFEKQHGEWVLSGVLFSASFDECEAQLNNKLSSLPAELTRLKDSLLTKETQNIKSKKDFHLTEFRKNFGHDVAVKMANNTMKKLTKLPFDYFCLATINHSKSTLSNREKIYRLMLSDLLALCETVIKDNQTISKLDLVVASRTIKGQLQTSISNIDEDVIKSLPMALEVGLATKGMVDLIGKHINVKMDYANNSWGLICADFLANLNYHYKKINEKKLLNELGEKGTYTRFESFGNYEIRRANVAERDNDYILSMVIWINVLYKNINNEKAKEAIQRLLLKIFNKRGTTGGPLAFESVLDRLWRQNSKYFQYSDLSIILKLFETELVEYLNNSYDSRGDSYLFRLRNLMLNIDNHLGKTSEGFEIIKCQRTMIPDLASNPEYFQLILDFKIAEIEVSVNALHFEQALHLSNEYHELILNYKDVWQLLLDDNNTDSFDKSRASIKSQMTLFRCNILCSGINDSRIDEHLSVTFDLLNTRLTNSIDKSRFRNYQIMFFLKKEQAKMAVDHALEQYLKDKNSLFNAFDLFWLLKAVNDALISNITVDIQVIKNIIDVQLQSIDINSKGHPIDLVLRELALFEYKISNKSLALKYMRKSKNSFNLENSEIGLWLKALINIHEDFITDKLKSEFLYFDSLPNNSFIKHILGSSEKLSFIEKVRYFSPY